MVAIHICAVAVWLLNAVLDLGDRDGGAAFRALLLAAYAGRDFVCERAR